MINKISKVLEKNEEVLDNESDKLLAMPDSKVLSKAEEIEVKSQFAAFQYTIEKCSMGHMVSPEFKGILDEFEKAEYDIDKMPASTRNTLKETYNEMKFAMDSNPGKFKNSAVSAYCILYDFVTGVPVKNLVKKIKKSKSAKKMGFSKEDLSNLESLEMMLYDNEHNLNKAFMSTEGVSEVFSSIGNFFRSGKAAATSVREVPGIIFDVRNVLTVISILLLVVTVAIVVMIIINMAQTSEMSKLLEELTAIEIQRMGGPDLAHQQLVVQAAENMNANLPVATKKMLIKPITSGVKSITKFNKKHPHDIENIIDEADKSTESFEQFKAKTEGMSTEGVMEMIKGAKQGLIDPLKSTASAHKGGLIAAASIAFLALALIPLLRAATYFIKHLKFGISAFFKGQSEWIGNNIEYLIEKAEDPNTPEAERNRLNRVIEKQKNWARTFSNISNKFYKNQIEAANDARDEIREEEKIDFDKLVVEEETTTLDASEEAPIVEAPPAPNLNNTPILVF